MSMEENFVVGVDLDGIVADFYGFMHQVVAEWFEADSSQLSQDTFDYRLTAWGIDTQARYNEIHRFAVTQRNLFLDMPMIPGARKYLRKLDERPEIRIRIITYRLFLENLHKLTVEQTITWLDKHAIPYWDLCFLRNKDEALAHFYIDDAPHNVQRLAAKDNKAVALKNPTNADLASDLRVTSWEEIYDRVMREFEHWLRSRKAPDPGKQRPSGARAS